MEDKFDHEIINVENEFLNIKNNINMVKTVHIYKFTYIKCKFFISETNVQFLQL